MCLQDLRIAAGASPRRIDGTYDASGLISIPDVRRALMVWGIDNLITFRLAWVDGNGTVNEIPSDTALGFSVAGLRVYTKQCFGWVPPGQLYVIGTPGGTCRIYIIEYDAAVDAAINDALVSRGT